MVNIDVSVSCLLLHDLADPSNTLCLIRLSINTNHTTAIALYKEYHILILAAPYS